MKLPKIQDSYNIKKNLTISDRLFLTTSDDIGFALSQIKQIKNKINAKKDRGLKLWERKHDSIYTSYENKSKLLIKKRKENKNKNLSLDWKRQTIFDKTEISGIEEGDEIKKNIRIKYDIKYKYKDKDQTISDFISTKNSSFLANTMIKILKDNQDKVIKKQENYSRALRHEILLLDKDINKFDEFTIVLDKKKKEDEALLTKRIEENKNLVNLYKRQLQEYNGTIYEIYKILKSMNEFKTYAKFIHKLLGGDNDILHCDLIGNINFKDFKNYDILSITQIILNKTRNLLNTELKKDFSKEIHFFELTFKDMEDKLVKLFLEKHEYESEINNIKKEGKLIEEKRQNKYDLLNENFEQLLKELQESIDEYNKISLTSEEEEIIKLNYAFLIEIYSFLFPKSGTVKNIKDLKVENAYDLKTEVVSPILSELNNLEVRVNGLLKTMEECDNENHELFEGFLNKKKDENRAIRLLFEKNKIKIKEEIKRKKYFNKMKKIIIKDRHKFNFRFQPKNSKLNQKKVLKTDINSDDLSYLY